MRADSQIFRVLCAIGDAGKPVTNAEIAKVVELNASIVAVHTGTLRDKKLVATKVDTAVLRSSQPRYRFELTPASVEQIAKVKRGPAPAQAEPPPPKRAKPDAVESAVDRLTEAIDRKPERDARDVVDNPLQFDVMTSAIDRALTIVAGGQTVAILPRQADVLFSAMCKQRGVSAR